MGCNLKGLTDFEEVEIIGGANNPSKEELVSFRIKKCPSEEIVTYLNQQGIEHIRGNVTIIQVISSSHLAGMIALEYLFATIIHKTK